jgi:hypothetical protein
MKNFLHYLRRGTLKPEQGRSWIPKRFFSALAAISVAVAVDHFWTGFIPDVHTLRFPLFLLGYLLLIDIVKIFKRK